MSAPLKKEYVRMVELALMESTLLPANAHMDILEEIVGQVSKYTLIS